MSSTYRPASRPNARCRLCSTVVPKGTPAVFGGNWQSTVIICDSCLDKAVEDRAAYRQEEKA